MIGLAQRLPTWATVTQCLGNRCPILGQRSPNGRVERCDASHSVPPHSSQSRIIAGLCLLRVRSTQCRLIVRNPASSRDCASCEFTIPRHRGIASENRCDRHGVARKGIGKQSPNHWETASQHWGTVPRVVGGRVSALRNHFRTLGTRFPNTWEKFSQYVGNDFPILGKRLPKTWAAVAQRLGKKVPGTWATGAECLGK